MNNKEIIIGADTASPLIARKPGYGTMRLTGEDFYGEQRDKDGAIALLRKAVEMGVNFFDTADFYGPGVTNKLLAEAVSPILLTLSLLLMWVQNGKLTKAGCLTASPKNYG